MKSDIKYTTFDSPLGPMIAGATAQGVCFLEWQDRGGVETILRRVEKRYGAMPTPGASKHLTDLQRELSAYFAGTLQEFTVSVDVTGTAFEQTVWRNLLDIPYGETRSYGDIAMAVGKPGAARAVGRANGANYLSIVIPCHRVIEANGNLRGYGGKVWRKRKLLTLEHTKQPGDLFSTSSDKKERVA